MLLVLLALAWMFGIVATDTLTLPGDILGGLAVLGIGGVVLGWSNILTRRAWLCLLLAALGGLRYLAVQVEPTPQSVWLLAGQGIVQVQGYVAAEPRRSDEGQQVMLQTEAARLDERAGQVEGVLLLNVPLWPAYHYGQRLIISGEIEQPPAANRPNAFDYRDYLARKRVFALVQEPEVQVLRGNAGNPLLVALLGFRDTCHARLLRALPEPQASVAAGMLLGLKAAVPDPTYDAFARTGLVHLLVVSGWHLSLVAGLLTGLAAHLRLGRGASFWVALAGIWLYALFVGATPTVLRAALMASLIVLAGSTSRKAEPWTLLLAACLALTLWEPQMLWDVGFQLSALATASLFAFSAPLHRWLEHLPALRWSGARAVTSTLAATLAVQVLVLPLILYHFGNLSLVAPLANVLLVPLVPFAMLLGALALVVSLAVAPLAGGLWLVAWLPFAALTGGAAWLAELPGASLRLPAFPLWVLFGYYALVFIGWMGQKWVRRWHTAVVWT